jgi:hypothetical protein
MLFYFDGLNKNIPVNFNNMSPDKSNANLPASRSIHHPTPKYLLLSTLHLQLIDPRAKASRLITATVQAHFHTLKT